MQKTINGSLFKSMMMTAAKLVEINRNTLDALIVFPVPDGDTGTNMSMTLQSSIKEIVKCQSNKISELTDVASKGALRGARGNSGVITSQVIRGICQTLGKADEIDTKVFANALMNGAQIAYGAVSKPKEGTILTVARLVAEHAMSVYRRHKDFESFFEEIIKAAKEAVNLTPTLLPVLKKAGVVDAGGRGLQFILEGMQKAILGETVEAKLISIANINTYISNRSSSTCIIFITLRICA